LSITQQC